MIIVTGGAGFIGSNIAQELSKKYRVVICDKLNDQKKKKNIAFVKGKKRVPNPAAGITALILLLISFYNLP